MLLFEFYCTRKQRAAVSILGVDLILQKVVNSDCEPYVRIDERLNHPLASAGSDLTFSSITIVTIRFPICEFGENNHCLYLHAIVCLQIPINQYSWRQFQSCFRLTLAINYSAGNYEANPQPL